MENLQNAVDRLKNAIEWLDDILLELECDENLADKAKTAKKKCHEAVDLVRSGHSNIYDAIVELEPLAGNRFAQAAITKLREGSISKN